MVSLQRIRFITRTTVSTNPRQTLTQDFSKESFRQARALLLPHVGDEAFLTFLKIPKERERGGPTDIGKARRVPEKRSPPFHSALFGHVSEISSEVPSSSSSQVRATCKRLGGRNPREAGPEYLFRSYSCEF